jgi:hypothetical protein
MFALIWKNWQPFFFSRLDARPLALFRILSGVLCVAMFLAIPPNWARFYDADGIISLHSPGLNNTRVNSVWGLFYWTDGILPIETYWVLALVCSAAYLVGFQTRIATAGLWLIIMSMARRNPYIVNGEEMVLKMCLLYFVFIDLGAAYSVDAWLARRRGQPRRTDVLAWPVRMMQINIALIYLISLPYKFAQDPGWITGDALHWTVASNTWGPHWWPWLTLSYGGFFRKAITFGTVVVEAFFPLAVWFQITRRPALVVIAGLHLGIAALIPNVTYFTLSMVCSFAAFLVKEDVDLLEQGTTILTRAIRRWFTPADAPTPASPA